MIALLCAFSAQKIDTNWKKISLATIIFLSACIFFPIWRSAYHNATETTPVVVDVVIPSPKPVIPVILKKISWCESGNMQFEKDGSIHRGKINPKDIGKYQINERWNGEEALRLGFDIYTLEGNTKMALHLYKGQGTTPWDWSRGCWADPDRVWWEKDGEYWSKNKK